MKYSTEEVEAAVALIWHDSYLLGEGDALPPDPDMPRSTYADPHRAERTLAIRADMQCAYRSLSEKHRIAVLCRYGLTLPFAKVADALGVSRHTGERITGKAIEEMKNYLNGETIDED